MNPEAQLELRLDVESKELPTTGGRPVKLGRRAAAGARVALWTAISLCAVGICLLVLEYPAAALLAISGGALARWLGQRVQLARVRHSSVVASLAAFVFDGSTVSCNFSDATVCRLVNSWQSKAMASGAAAGLCFATQRTLGLRLSLLPQQNAVVHWMTPAIEAASFCLPALAALLFLRRKGPVRRWSQQVRVAVQRRATASLEKILAERELDGLEAGIDVLRRELGLDSRGNYRASVSRRLRSHPVEAVLRPEAVLAFQRVILELARLDLKNLSKAAENFRRLRCRMEAVKTIASISHDPVYEMQLEELDRQLERFSTMTAQQEWEELPIFAADMEQKLEAVSAKLRRHAASAPQVVLSPANDPYGILGVNIDTPVASIKKLRLRLAQLYHPDSGDCIGNGVKMAELNAAFDAVMRDQEKRGR